MHISQLKAEGYRLVVGYLGIVFILAGVIVLLPLLFLIAYPEEIDNAVYFIAPGTMSILSGYLLSFLIKDKVKGQLHKHQDSVIVVAAWIIAIVVAAIPFMLTGRYNLVQSVFETTSGFSTTGLSVVDVEKAPKIFLAYRSIMLFFGGIGLVLVMTSVLSDRYGMRLYTAEGHSDRLIPNLLKSARIIIVIYSGYIIAGIVLYMIFGMSWFDAFNHSIASLSTGGFSTRSQNIGYFKSFPIEIITIVLMLLGSTNFLVHLLLIQGRFSGWIKHSETRLSAFLLALSVPPICFALAGSFGIVLPEAARLALFQAVSALTTTGFQTTPTFNSWPSSALFLMILLMLIGGGAGSTAGGIKQTRIALLMKSIAWEMRNKFFHKRIVRSDRIYNFGNPVEVSVEDKYQVGLFALCYLLIFAVGTLIFTFFGNTIQDSAFEFASALGTVGLSIGITNYGAHPIVLWTAIAGMFLGRLEIIVVFMGVARIVKDAKGTFHRR